MSKGDDAAALPPPRRSYMRGARLLGTVAGSRMAAAVESEAMRVKARIFGCFPYASDTGWLDCAAFAAYEKVSEGSTANSSRDN